MSSLVNISIDDKGSQILVVTYEILFTFTSGERAPFFSWTQLNFRINFVVIGV